MLSVISKTLMTLHDAAYKKLQDQLKIKYADEMDKVWSDPQIELAGPPKSLD